MVRSVTRLSSHQPLAVQDGSCNCSNSEESKSIRYSPCCCLKTIRYILVIIFLLCFVFYKQHNNSITIESNVSNLRATVSRFLFDFEIKSSAFIDGHSIPSKYNTTFSPPLQWNYQPYLTKSYALIVEDIDTSNKFKHWIMYNIPSTVNALSEGILVWPDGTAVMRNDYSRFRYDGPSPRDVREHRYVFRLIALSIAQLEISSGTGKVASYDDLENAMEPFILEQATLMGTYSAMNHD